MIALEVSDKPLGGFKQVAWRFQTSFLEVSDKWPVREPMAGKV